jgi:hypothetical protein
VILLPHGIPVFPGGDKSLEPEVGNPGRPWLTRPGMGPEKGVDDYASRHHGISRKMIPVNPVVGIKEKHPFME